jgi:hypothetical protein
MLDQEGRLNALSNHIIDLLPTISLIVGVQPKGLDLREMMQTETAEAAAEGNANSTNGTPGNLAPIVNDPDAKATVNSPNASKPLNPVPTDNGSDRPKPSE